MNTSEKSDVPRLVITCDLGGSKIKVLAQIYPDGVPTVIAIDPEIADVGEKSISRYKNESLGENAAWVKVGSQYYALGTLAKTAFAGTAALKELKLEYALPKIAAVLWQAYRKLNLDSSNAFLQVLLPPGEANESKTLTQKVSTALKQGIITPTGRLKMKLRHLYISPEGAGIFMQYRQTLGQKYGEKNIGLLMLGYRNASCAHSQKGHLLQAESTELGMSWMVERFVQMTAVGLSKDDWRVVEALIEAGNDNFEPFSALSRKSAQSGIDSDLKVFREVLPIVRDEYCRALLRWIRQTASLDEILICGGTASFIREELTEYFNKESVPIIWSGGVKIPPSLDTQGLGERFADAWASHTFYIKMLDENFGYNRQKPLVPIPTPPPAKPEAKPEAIKEVESRKAFIETLYKGDPWKDYLPMKEGI